MEIRFKGNDMIFGIFKNKKIEEKTVKSTKKNKHRRTAFLGRYWKIILEKFYLSQVRVLILVN